MAEIARAIKSYKVIVEKSTVPVYTNDWIRRVLHRHGVAQSTLMSSPIPSSCVKARRWWIFCILTASLWGQAMRDRRRFCGESMSRSPAANYYARPGAVPGMCAGAPAKLLVTSTQSAEIIKHASNAFLAMKISFINAVANLAEAVDADIEDIAAGIGLDSRIGPKFLRAGLGYGGSCFPKDVAAFHWVAQERGVNFAIARGSPQDQRHAKGSVLQQSALGALDSARQAAGSAGPGIQGRHGRHPRFAGHCDDQTTAASGRHGDGLRSGGDGTREGSSAAASKLKYADSVYHAAKDADALLILTDWKEFAALDLVRLEPCAALPYHH